MGDPVQEQLVSFATLPEGWHYGQGKAPSFATIIQGLRIIASLRSEGVSTFEVFPAVGGEVMISAYGGDMNVDITTSDIGRVTYVIEQNETEIDAKDEPCDFADLVQTIKKNGWLGCNSLDSSTLGTIATKRGGSFRQRSLLPTNQEYRLSSQAA
jgi:hypothetical protein